MIDINELRRLAQAAIAKMSASDPEFASSTPPLAILELLDRLEAAEEERDALRAELTDLRNSMMFRTSLIGRIEAEREDLYALIAAVKSRLTLSFA